MTKALKKDLSGPGQMRVVGEPIEPGLPLVGTDVALEVLQSDGTWLPLRGVTQFRLSVLPDQLTLVHDLTVEIGLIDVTALTSQVARLDGKPMVRGADGLIHGDELPDSEGAPKLEAADPDAPMVYGKSTAD